MAYVKGINIVIGADTTKLDSALRQIDTNSRKLNSELKQINSSLKFDPKNTDLLAQKQKVLNERFVETKSRLEALKSAQESVNQAYKNGDITEAQYRQFNTDIAATESRLKGYEKQLNSVTEAYNHHSSTLGKASEGLKDFGNMATDASKKFAPASLAATGVLTLASKAAMDFESAFAGVAKTVEGTPEQMDKIRIGIRNMAKEIPASTTEISAVAEAAGQLGIETDNVLEFTRVMIDMGEATSYSSDTAATEMARFANITKMSQKDFDRLGSSIVALGNNFATTESEIGSMALNLGAAGTQVGMSQADILALATALSSVGIEAQAGGTAFSKLMIEMQLATETGSEKLNDFATVAGLTADQFSKSFKEDATGAILAFIDGLSKSGEQGTSAIKVLDDMGITETRLRDSLLRSANASEILSKAVGLSNEAWDENNALTLEAETRYATSESKLAIMKNKLNDVAISLGEKVLPHLVKFMEWLGELVDGFNNLSPGMQDFIVKSLAITAATAPVLGIVGKLSSGLGTLVGGIGSTGRALGLLKPAATVASAAMSGLTSAAGATTTGFLASAGGVGGLLSSLGSVAVAAAPFALGIGAIGLAAYGIYQVVTEDANPAIDLFADKLELTTTAVGEYGTQYESTVIKISEATKNSVGEYVVYSDQLRSEAANLYVGLSEVTDEGIDGLMEKNTLMNESLLTKAEERKNSDLEILSSLFDDSSTMTDERQAEILGIVTTNYDNQKLKTEELRDRLNVIYQEIKEQGVGATKEQKDEIESLLNQMNENAINILSENELERNVILNRLNDYTLRENKETISQIIQDLNTQHDDSVSLAQQTYEEQVRLAERMRLDGTAESSKAADDIIAEATRQKDETIKQLDGLRLEGFEKLEGSYANLSDDFNLTNGKIRNGWDKMWNTNKKTLSDVRSDMSKTSQEWKNTDFPNKTTYITTYHDDIYRTKYVSQGSSGYEYGNGYNNGLDYVPFNNFQARLHKGERVLTAVENEELESQGYLSSMKNKLMGLGDTLVSNTVNNESLVFNLGGTYSIREEADIVKLSRELANQVNKIRRGGRNG